MSKDGRLGQGIYFTGSLETATQIAKSRDQGVGCAVLVCRVDRGKKIANVGIEIGSSWQWHFDSAEGTHPPWAGVKKSFTEYCIKSKQRCSIIEVMVVSGKKMSTTNNKQLSNHVAAPIQSKCGHELSSINQVSDCHLSNQSTSLQVNDVSKSSQSENGMVKLSKQGGNWDELRGCIQAFHSISSEEEISNAISRLEMRHQESPTPKASRIQKMKLKSEDTQPVTRIKIQTPNSTSRTRGPTVRLKKVIKIIDECPVNIQYTNLLYILKRLPSQYELNFEVMIQHIGSEGDIIQLRTTAREGEHGYCTPLIRLRSDGRLNVCSSISGNPHYVISTQDQLDEAKWQTVGIQQQLNPKNSKLLCHVTINGGQALTIENTDARSFDNVRVYTCARALHVANGQVRNVKVSYL